MRVDEAVCESGVFGNNDNLCLFDTLTRRSREKNSCACKIRQKITCLNDGPKTVQGHAVGWQANVWVATQARDALKLFEHAYLVRGAAVQEHLMQVPRVQPKLVSICAFHQQGAHAPSVRCETKSGNKGNTRQK